MCGISGFISKEFNEAQLAGMVATTVHRGPDACGTYMERCEETTIGLGHNRLSVLDLSTCGNQPMTSADTRFAIVYNGEIYNFNELKAKLPEHQWKSSGDTEVVLECFARFGPDCLPWFNGMFAFAVWDKVERKMYLCRDRIGIKPLYYFSSGTNFAFASELKGLQSLPIQHTLSIKAIKNFLFLGYIPQDQTIYEDCFKLLPGHYAVANLDGYVETGSFWKLEDCIRKSPVTDKPRAKEKLNELMESAVRRCLISDVPVGILLSGGVDSSLVAAIAQKHHPEKIRTFSIAFEDGRYDESKYAQQVADHIHSHHTKFTVNEETGISVIKEFLNIYDEPYGDMSGIPTYLVSKLARQEVTVALSGDGADELFMGYGTYTWAKRLSNPLIRTGRALMRTILYNADKDKFRNRSYLFEDPGKFPMSSLFSQAQGNWTIDEISSLLRSNSKIEFEEWPGDGGRILLPQEKQSFFDLKNYLPEDLLTKMDRASMQHGLEIRVPFLDSEIVDFALNLSPDLKYHGTTQKSILKEVLYDYAPKEFFARPKWGFAVPMKEWLTGKLSYLIDDYLNHATVDECGILDPVRVTAFVNKFRAGETFRYHRIWLLIILQKWLVEKKSTYSP